MAQELIDKIRAAAQAKGIDPDTALRIARAESSMATSAKAGTSSAGGLFQVVDKTWKEFGGAPGKKFDPDENIRVGTDIISSNTNYLRKFLQRDPRPAEIYAAHYFGPTGAKTFLSAEPGTPMESLFSEKVIRDNPNLKGKTSGQVMATLETKMGGTPSAAPAPAPYVSRETQTPAEQTMEPALRSGMTAQALTPAPVETSAQPAAPDRLASLGPGYQAALALSFLADNDDREDRDTEKEPGIAEKYLAEMDAVPRPSGLTQFADVKIRSPFAEPPQPQMLAKGGEVVDESDELLTEKEIRAAQEQYPDLPSSQAVYMFHRDGRYGNTLSGNFGARIPLDEDTEATLMLSGSRSENNPSSSKAMLAMLNQRIGEGNIGATLVRPMDAPNGLYSGSLSGSYPLGEGRINGNVNAMRTPNGQTKMTGYGIGYGGRVGPGDLSVGVSRQGNSGPFSGQLLYRIPIGRAGGSPETGEQAPTAEELKAASKPAFLTPKSGIGRKISTKPGELEAAALQGISETPYNLVGAPVDLATMAMRPFGYTNEKPFLGSEDLKERALKAGIRQKPPEGAAARALYEMTQFGSGFVNPAAPVRGAVKAAKMLEDVTVGNIQRGQVRRAGSQAENIPDTAYDPLRDRMQASGNLAYAVKPKGGTFGYTPNDPDRVKPITDLGKLMQQYGTEARDLGAGNELIDFLKAKAPKYFINSYGTADDPLRTAIRERRIEPFGRDAEKIRPYLVDAANNPEARGHLAAKIDLEKAYDERTGIRAFALKPEDSTSSFQKGMREDISTKLGQEGVPIEARNLPEINDYSQSDFTAYPTSSAMLRRMVESQETMPPNIQRALQTGETIYDARPRFSLLEPNRVIEALQEVPANKLGNMSFPEALIQGTQALAPVRDYLIAVALAEKGASVPRKALDLFTTPVQKAPSFGGNWVTIDKPVATRMEGELMNHSIGGYSSGDNYGLTYTGLPYGGKKAFDEGLVRVYSLRDERGMPKVTVEMAKSDAGKGDTWNVTQIRGRFNSEPPPKARDDIFRLLEKVDTQDGLKEIRQNSYYKLPTGESGPGSVVDWNHEYGLWKLSGE